MTTPIAIEIAWHGTTRIDFLNDLLDEYFKE